MEYEPWQMQFKNAVTLENLSLLTLSAAPQFKALPGTSQVTSETNYFQLNHLRKQLVVSKCHISLTSLCIKFTKRVRCDFLLHEIEVFGWPKFMCLSFVNRATRRKLFLVKLKWPFLWFVQSRTDDLFRSGLSLPAVQVTQWAATATAVNLSIVCLTICKMDMILLTCLTQLDRGLIFN